MVNNENLREYIPEGENVIFECEGMIYGYDYTEYAFVVTENAVWLASLEDENCCDFIKASAIGGVSRDISDDYYTVSIHAVGEPTHAYFSDEDTAKEFYKAVLGAVCGTASSLKAPV